MPSLGEEASFLRLSLAMGLLDTGAAVAWADRTIMAFDAPPIEVIELSLAGGKPADEVVGLLEPFGGSFDPEASAHRVLGLLHDRLEAGSISTETALKMLEAYSNFSEAPEDEKLKASCLSDPLWWASEGGTLAEVRDDMVAFLNRHALPPLLI